MQDSVGKAQAIPFIANLLKPQAPIDPVTINAVSHAASCLWRLVVDHRENKLLFTPAIVEMLLAVCEVQDSRMQFAQKLAVGCLAELCLGNEQVRCQKRRPRQIR